MNLGRGRPHQAKRGTAKTESSSQVTLLRRTCYYEALRAHESEDLETYILTSTYFQCI